jgi:diacylglycerol kinase family enzyme
MDLIDCNGRLGIGVVCAGVDARIADDVDRYKRLPLVKGLGAYIMSLVVNVLFKGITRPCIVDAGELHYEGDVSIVCVCSGRYYGGGFMPVGDNMPDDGMIETLVVPKVGLLTFARLVGAYGKGRYKEHPNLIWPRKENEISIASANDQDVVVCVDGEIVRDHAFTIKLSEKKVNFFYPGDLSYEQR